MWKSKGLSHKCINSITASNYSITPSLEYLRDKIRKKLNGSCFKQGEHKLTYNHGKIVKIYIIYKINENCNISISYPTLENIFFGAVSLAENNDNDECKYSGYDIGFDREGTFSVGNEFGRNCIIFEVDMNCSVYVDYKKKDILIFGESPTQGLDGTTSTAKKYIQ